MHSFSKAPASPMSSSALSRMFPRVNVIEAHATLAPDSLQVEQKESIKSALRHRPYKIT